MGSVKEIVFCIFPGIVMATVFAAHGQASVILFPSPHVCISGNSGIFA